MAHQNRESLPVLYPKRYWWLPGSKTDSRNSDWNFTVPQQCWSYHFSVGLPLSKREKPVPGWNQTPNVGQYPLFVGELCPNTEIHKTIMSKNFVFCKIWTQISLCQAHFCVSIISNGNIAASSIKFRKHSLLNQLRKNELSDGNQLFELHKCSSLLPN